MATKKKHNVWMPLYVADYIADTMGLTTEQHGAYLLLLMSAWHSDGKLPSDPEQLRQITRMSPRQWAAAAPILQRYFIVTEDFWLHNRVRAELEKAKDKVAKKASAGVVGAANKWGLTLDEPAPGNREKRSERLANARRRGTHTREEWEALVEICGGLCVRCGATPEPSPSKDHITPIYQGGSDSIANLQPLCRQCNSSKGPDTTDHRPSDWLERVTERLAKRLTNASHEN